MGSTLCVPRRSAGAVGVGACAGDLPDLQGEGQGACSRAIGPAQDLDPHAGGAGDVSWGHLSTAGRLTCQGEWPAQDGSTSAPQ